MFFICAIMHQSHLPYDHNSAQWLTINCHNRKRSFHLNLALSCLNRLQSELIRNGLGNKVEGVTQVNEHQAGVITLAPLAIAKVHQDNAVWCLQQCIFISVIFASCGRAQCCWLPWQWLLFLLM